MVIKTGRPQVVVQSDIPDSLGSTTILRHVKN
jgi:hypothetical protein